MIQPQELRIGNLISAETNDGLQIVQILQLKNDVVLFKYKTKLDMICQTGDNYEHVNPIPLSWERVRNCGFNPDDSGYLSIDVGADFCLGYDVDRNVIELLLDGSDIEVEQDADSIHQLQNLYFALTGKELEYNAASPLPR